MGRVFITGDKHGDFNPYHQDYAKIERFCSDFGTTTDDIMIILGDHGITYYTESDHKTRKMKEKLASMPITFVLIHGNHDQRPTSCGPKMLVKQTIGGSSNGNFYVEEAYPNILYTTEYGWYTFAGHRTFVIGGAYSIDKQYRLEKQREGFLNYRWFYNEQLNATERENAYQEYIDGVGKDDCLIMSHTCPMYYRPTEALMSGIDKSLEDNTMEDWMNTIADVTVTDGSDERLAFDTWYCGHWHIDKNMGKMRFMYHDIDELN